MNNSLQGEKVRDIANATENRVDGAPLDLGFTKASKQ